MAYIPLCLYTVVSQQQDALNKQIMNELSIAIMERVRICVADITQLLINTILEKSSCPNLSGADTHKQSILQFLEIATHSVRARLLDPIKFEYSSAIHRQRTR